MTEESDNDLAIKLLSERVDQQALRLADKLARLNAVYVGGDRDDELQMELKLVVAHMLQKDAREGYAIAVTGPSGAGKSTLVNRTLDHIDAFRPFDDGHGNDACFCLRVQTPASATAIDLGVAILRASGYDLKKTPPERDVWNIVRERLRINKHKVIFMDEFQHALKSPNAKGTAHLTNTIKILMQDEKWPVWIIMAGIPVLLELVERDEWFQTERRLRPISLDDVENNEDEIENTIAIIEELAKAVDLDVSFPLIHDFIRRVMHGGLWRLGMIVQLIKMSIEVALMDEKGDGKLKHEHFIKGYKRLSNCDKATNVIVAEDWHLIERQVTKENKLTRHSTKKKAA